MGDYLLEKTKIIQGCLVQTRDQNHTKAASINKKKKKNKNYIVLRWVRSSKVFWESLHPHCFVTCLRNNICMEELCGNGLTHWQTDANNKQIHTCRLLRLNLNESMSPWIPMTHVNIVEEHPTGELPAMFTTSKKYGYFFSYLSS